VALVVAYPAQWLAAAFRPAGLRGLLADG